MVVHQDKEVFRAYKVHIHLKCVYINSSKLYTHRCDCGNPTILKAMFMINFHSFWGLYFSSHNGEEGVKHDIRRVAWARRGWIDAANIWWWYARTWKKENKREIIILRMKCCFKTLSEKRLIHAMEKYVSLYDLN